MARLASPPWLGEGGRQLDRIASIEDLERLYGVPGKTSLVKEVDRLIPEYAAIIAASPFVALATCGPEGLDCSPRGDLAGFVRIVDPGTLMMPDRHGNNRADSLKNIVRDGRAGLLFLVPGSGTTLRVNGTAFVAADADLCESFTVEGKPARSVIVLSIEAVYFQCARAIRRSDLWNPDRHVLPGSLPSPGAMLAATSGQSIDADAYDKEWPQRASATMW